jgi:hypothetical protein
VAECYVCAFAAGGGIRRHDSNALDSCHGRISLRCVVPAAKCKDTIHDRVAAQRRASEDQLKLRHLELLYERKLG